MDSLDSPLGFFILFAVLGFLFFMIWLVANNQDLTDNYVSQKNIDEERDGLAKKAQQLIERDFLFKKCTKCSDTNLELIRFNSQFTSVEMKCQTCNKKTWYKHLSNDEERIDELIITMDSLNDYMEEYFEGESVLFYTKAKDENEIQNEVDNEEEISRHSIPRSVQDRVWRRDEGKCVQCGDNRNLEFDHIIPVSRGGANTYRNIQLLCEKCNRSKSNNIG